MTTQPGALAAAAALLCAAAACTPTTPAPKARPEITSFSADKPRIDAGDTVTLSFAAKDATTATLTDQTGAKVELAGDAANGTATVAPGATTFYVLEVSGPGGTADAFVQVAVGEALQDAYLVAAPPSVASGERAHLLWSAAHAKQASITSSSGETIALDLGVGSGVVDVTPARTTTYHLSAHAADATKLFEQDATVEVQPVLASFTATPAAARVGETITFAWSTRGAGAISLSEKSFGVLYQAAVPSDENAVDEGTFTWTVPEKLADGSDTPDGYALSFTLTATQTTPSATLTKTISSFVGDGPNIVRFDAPNAVTVGHTFELAWKTLNADRVQIFADGGLVYEPLPREIAQRAHGKITLNAPAKDTTFTLVASGPEGTHVESAKQVRVVPLPVISDFTVPASVQKAGDEAHVTWATQNATHLTVRLDEGAVLTFTDDPVFATQGATNLYPGARATFVLEAFNDAGDSVRASKTIEVAAPGTLTASPSPVATGEKVSVGWTLDSTLSPTVIGDPTALPLHESATTEWVELDGNTDSHPLTFAEEDGTGDADDGLAEIRGALPGFRFPFVGEAEQRFFASTNGFVSFGPNAPPLAGITTLDDATLETPPMVAPFWDDLVLGASGRVLYLWDDTSFPRRLIVQWDKVELKSDGASTLSFQVQLFETGAMRFAYKTLSGGNGAHGEAAHIGWRLNGTQALEAAQGGTANVNEGDGIVFFGGTAQGTFEVAPNRTSEFVLYAPHPTQANAYVVYPARVNVIAPGAVTINEAMVLPDTSAISGRWVELKNTTSDAQDVSGAVLHSEATQTSFVLPEGTVIPPRAYLVLGESADPLLNGGAPVAVEWSGFSLSDTQDETLTLSAVSAISSLSYTAAALQARTSVQPSDGAIDATGGTLPCARSTTFGTNGALGTPGGRNETCFEYVRSPIPESFEDISASGTPLFDTSSGFPPDEVTAVVEAAPTPVSAFGAQFPEFSVCTDGWIALAATTTPDANNALTPSEGSTPAHIAPFWDDLLVEGIETSNVFVQHLAASPVARGRWIVQWHNATHYSAAPDTLDFEAKLFDDGVIEFHYATMVSGTPSKFADGHAATIWLERPTRDAALPIGINAPVIVPHSAYRFTPSTHP